MNNETESGKETTTNQQVNFDDDTPDRGIIPAETAARREREGSEFKTTPTKAGQEGAKTNDQADPDSIDVTGGYTVDKEGLGNNYAIEPEIYVDEPGDLRQEEEESTAERAQELENVNQDEEGKLTMEGDKRGKGQGII
jgi:hypothetical protein